MPTAIPNLTELPIAKIHHFVFSYQETDLFLALTKEALPIDFSLIPTVPKDLQVIAQM